MLKLTKQEMYVIAFLASAIVLGSAVRQWRAHKNNRQTAVVTTDTRTP
jgi:hypothetical protein